jgi:hypothetical protein
MLKIGKFGGSIVLVFALFLSGCGYYFPHVYNGPARIVYMPTWQNRTNKLELNNKIYQSLARWFQKSEAINLTKDNTKGDLILTGEILSIDLPSVSWDGVSVATSTKVKLFVRYVLKDLKTGAILWEVPRKLYTADFTLNRGNINTDPNTFNITEDEALKLIIEDMSEHIYLGILNKIRKQNQQTPAAP